MYPMVHETHNFPIPTLPFIYGHFDNIQDQHYVANWHTNIEVFHIRSGAGYVLYDSREIPVVAGDTVVISRGVLHTCRAASRDTDEEMSYDYLIIDREFCIQNGIDSNTVYFCPYFHEPAIVPLLDMFAAYWNNDPAAHVVALRAAALSILSMILDQEHAPEGPPPTSAVPDKNQHIKRVIGYIEEHLAEPISLASLAEMAGISRCHLAHLFQEATGVTVVTYIQMLRCRSADILLRSSSMSIAEISQECGFGSVSYFDRCFSRHFGKTPRQVRSK